MPGPVERWLETFMCKQYADTFEAYGFKTLQSVCQLQLPQLQAMGVAQEHCEKILENVHVLRQTLYGTANHYQDDLYSGGGNGARMQNSGYHPPNSQGMPGMPQGMPSFTGQGSGNFGSRRPGQMMQGQFSGPDGMYRGQHPQQFMGQSYGGVQGSTGHGHYGGGQYGPVNSGYGSMPGGGSYGGGAPMQGTMQQPQKQQQQQQQQGGPHSGQMQRLGMMGQGQSPQDVANSILQMTAAYQPNQTVQVPISKSRPAPYHIPKSPHYNMASQSSSPTHQLQQQYPGAGGPGGVGRQFVYPNSSPHHSHPSRTSPISPSPGYMHSPASHHSGQSLPNSSPRSIQSPPLHTGPGPVCVKSPVAPPSPVGGLKSPCAMQSPANSGQGSICSPTPLNQQLHVSVSSQGLHSYPGQSPTQQMKNASRYSPKTNPISPPASQISSPYTPLSKSSIHSPPQVEQFTSPHNTQEYISDSTHEPSDTNSKSGSSNPLMSLQKLCMLPEKQVVDPKSVVNDACLPSPQNPKNLDSNADTQGSSGNHGDGSCGSALESSNSNSQQCADGKHCNEGIGDHKSENISCKSEMCSVSEPSEPPKRTKELPESKEGGNCVKMSHCDSPPKLVSEADMLGKTVLENKTIDKEENCDVNKTMLNGDVQSDGLSSIPTDEEGEDLISEEEEDNRDKQKQELTKPPNSALSQARQFSCDVKLIYSDDCVINGKNYILNSEKCLETLSLPSPNTNNKLTDSSAKNVITDVKNLVSDIKSTGEAKSILNDVNSVKNVDKDVKSDVIVRGDLRVNSTHKNNSQKNSVVSNSTSRDINTSLKHDGSTPLKRDSSTEPTPEMQDSKDKVESNNARSKVPAKQSQPERTRSLRSVPARLAGAAYYNNYSDSDSNDDGILLVRKDNKSTYSRIATGRKSSEVEESCSDVDSNGKALLAEKKCSDGSKNPGNHRNKIASDDEIDGGDDGHLQNNSCDKQKKQARKEKSVLVRKDLDEDNKDHTSESEVNTENKSNSLQSKKNVPDSSVHIRSSKRINRKRKKAPASKYRDIYFGGDYILDSEEEMEMERKSKLSKKLNDNVVKAKAESIVVLDSEDDEDYVPKMKQPKKSCDSSVKVKNENLHKFETLSDNMSVHKVSVENKNQGAPKVLNKMLNITEKQIKSEPRISGNPRSVLVKKPRGRPPGKTSKGSSKGKLKKLEKSKRAFICSDDDSITEMRLKRTVDLMKKKHKKRSDYRHRTAGPFIRLKGSVDSPEECLVVNCPDGDKPTDSKSNRRKKKSTSVSVSTVHMSRLPTEKSILVPSSYAVETETTWVCALCKKHSSYRFLGDLFGPYYIEGNLPQPKMQESPLQDSINKNKRKKSLETGDSAEKNRKPRPKSRKSGHQEPREVWVHEDCLAWGNGVLLIGPRIYGLEEACHIASATMCSQCRETGAMVGCLHKGCSQKYHYICAVDTGCYMDEENFSLLCPKHKDKKMNKNSADAALSKT